ncbi:MAG: hypothetical protein R6W92_04765 [Desulfocurvibacter africanus]
MNESLRMLDQALDVGRKELELLVAGEIEQAEALAHERGDLINNALARESTDRDPQVLRDRLGELQELHNRITSQAMRLREEVKADLLRTRQEGKRMDGYRSGVRGGAGVQSRFISKHG